MAGFNTHLFWGIAGGGVLAVAGYSQGHIDFRESGAVIVLGTLGGLLPDLDSDTGKPLKLLFQLLSAIIPMLLYSYAKNRYGSDLTTLLLFFALSYLGVQYLLCPLIKKITIHRGIMHSIPFALLCGQMTFLIFSGVSQKVATYYAVAVFGGCMLHLLLDEFYSISFKGFKPRFNRASGSALALYSKNAGATLLVYLLLFSTGYMIFSGKFNLNLTKILSFISGLKQGA